jgi:hypothetical protein
MVILRLGVACKALVSFMQQLRRHGEVILGGTQIHVSQVRRQLREQVLHVPARSIPREKMMLSGRVPKIVQSRLVARIAAATDVRAFAEAAKRKR